MQCCNAAQSTSSKEKDILILSTWKVTGATLLKKCYVRLTKMFSIVQPRAPLGACAKAGDTAKHSS